MSTYAVGDLQGCLTPLQQLLVHVEFNPDVDQLWVAGDLVNRGPQSLEVLRFLYSLNDCVKVILGNHDIHLLAVAAGCRNAGRSDTFDDILNAPDRDVLLDWLSKQPLLHHDKNLNFTMVHAGIPPQWSLKKAKQYAKEVHKALSGKKQKKYLTHIYGNEPATWDDALNGMTRLRLITNYLTRMRYCKTDGELELQTKSKATPRLPGGYRPWFLHKKRKTAKDKIIFGHWAALEGRANHDKVFALDTGYAWGGALTLMRLEDQQRFVVGA